MNKINLDVLIERAASQSLRQRQYETFVQMENSVHMTLDVFRQIAAPDQMDYTSVRTILGAFAELACPKSYLEIGTRRGHSLCMVANSTPDLKQVYSFDLWIENYAGEANPGAILVKKELEKLNFNGDIYFFPGDSKKTIPAFFKNVSNPQEIDLIFVDGDHSDEGARTDLLNVVNHLSVGGLLVFDDITHPSHRSLYQVWHQVMDNRPNFELRENTQHEYGWAIALRTH